MTLKQDWKTGKFLEWHVHLPYDDRPQISTEFMIQNVECSFLFSRYSKSYYVYLKPSKNVSAKLEKFPLTIYINNGLGTNFEKSECIFKHSDTYLLCFPESTFTNQTLNFSRGFLIQFLFAFEPTSGLLSLETKDDKSTQADLMLSLQSDMEYLSLDFGELLKNGDHSDVLLLCSEGSIPVHRAVLAARSKAFSDMLKENTEESKNGLINMTATEKSVMELCLEFIYKGKIMNLPVEKACNLYVMGHTLNISSLTKMCADLMIRDLREDNYIPYLTLADKCNDDYFKCGLIDYIREHSELLKSENWIEFSDKHMKTALDVYRKMHA